MLKGHIANPFLQCLKINGLTNQYERVELD
jgi:hypothetical protein